MKRVVETGKVVNGVPQTIELSDDGYRIHFRYLSGAPDSVEDGEELFWAEYKQCDIPATASFIAKLLMQSAAAPEVKDEPVAWRFRSANGTGEWKWCEVFEFTERGLMADYETQRLYTHQSPRIAQLEDALRDMLSGWKYIREVHGDLYGVGWDRAQKKAEDALK